MSDSPTAIRRGKYALRAMAAMSLDEGRAAFNERLKLAFSGR